MRTLAACSHALASAPRAARSATTHKKALKKRHFSHQQGGKPLAKARACAIFRADSLYAETVAPRFMLTKFFFEE
jgi:hypothetical protein